MTILRACYPEGWVIMGWWFAIHYFGREMPWHLGGKQLILYKQESHNLESSEWGEWQEFSQINSGTQMHFCLAPVWIHQEILLNTFILLHYNLDYEILSKLPTT